MDSGTEQFKLLKASEICVMSLVSIMEEQSCPRCKTTKYRNPSLKLMVNVCGHALCENCVELLFVRGSGACPECGVAIRRSNFRVQMFEDAVVEKEVDIRKRILKDFNKKEEDFSTLREYNDYLETIETIVFKMVNGCETEETKKQIEQYKKDNLDAIRKNRSKLSKDDEFLELLIEEEKHEQEFYRSKALEDEQTKQREKRKNKDALIDELMFSDLPANHILATHRREVGEKEQEAESIPRQRPTTFSSGIRMGQHQKSHIAVAKEDLGVLFVYHPISFEYFGPETPATESLEPEGFLGHIRVATDQELGGGYMANMGCQRALQEAYCGLFFSVKDIEAAQLAGSHFNKQEACGMEHS